jgi:hypothetical protein
MAQQYYTPADQNPWETMVQVPDPEVPIQMPLEMVPKRITKRVESTEGASKSDKKNAVLEALLAQYGAKSQELINAQQSGIGQLEQSVLDMKQTPRGIDFSPLAAYFDSTVEGSNLMRAVPKVESENERQQKIMSLENALQQRREGLTKSQTELLKEQIGAYMKAQEDPLKDLKSMAQIEWYRNSSQGRDDRLSRQSMTDEKDFLKTDDAKKLKAQQELKEYTSRYKDLLQQHGYQATGEKKKQLEAAFNQVGIKYKEAAGLGALTGPDWDIVKGVVAPQTGVQGALQQVTGGGTSGAVKGLDELLQGIELDSARSYGSVSTVYPKELVDRYMGNIKSNPNTGGGAPKYKSEEEEYQALKAKYKGK